MSRVYFHSPSGTAEIRGAERAYGSALADDLAFAVFGFENAMAYHSEHNPTVRFLDAIRPPLDPWARERLTNLKAMLRYGGGEACVQLPGGRQATVSSLFLNTALTVGSDALRLLAFIHAQCEIHGWFAGPNREWVADIITKGRADSLLRADMGWEGLVDFLRADQTEPVVMSYSVCEQFPNSTAAQWTPGEDENYDAWYDLPIEDRWALCMPNIARHEITPDRLSNPRYFGCQLNAFDVLTMFANVEAAV